MKDYKKFKDRNKIELETTDNEFVAVIKITKRDEFGAEYVQSETVNIQHLIGQWEDSVNRVEAAKAERDDLRLKLNDMLLVLGKTEDQAQKGKVKKNLK